MSFDSADRFSMSFAFYEILLLLPLLPLSDECSPKQLLIRITAMETRKPRCMVGQMTNDDSRNSGLQFSELFVTIKLVFLISDENLFAVDYFSFYCGSSRFQEFSELSRLHT
jgi:hypothetical protein